MISRLMTNGGTFVINGAERVIVSQIVRSPGMYYGDTVDKADYSYLYRYCDSVPRRLAGIRDRQPTMSFMSVSIKTAKFPLPA